MTLSPEAYAGLTRDIRTTLSLTPAQLDAYLLNRATAADLKRRLTSASHPGWTIDEIQDYLDNYAAQEMGVAILNPEDPEDRQIMRDLGIDSEPLEVRR